MKGKIEPLVFYIITLITICLAVRLLYNYVKIKTKDSNYEVIYDKVPFKIDSIENMQRTEYYNNNSRNIYTILFVMSSTACKQCTKQFQLFETCLNNKIFRNSISKYVVVVDTNMIYSKWIARSLPLKMDAIYNMNKIDRDILLSYKNRIYDKQIVVIENNYIVLRIIIKSYMNLSNEEVNYIIDNNIYNLINNKFHQAS